jgi:hypothetical protein
MSDQPTQIPLPVNTQHSQDIDIHTAYGIRTCKPSKQVVTDPRAATGIGMLYFALVNKILRDSKEIHLYN